MLIGKRSGAFIIKLFTAVVYEFSGAPLEGRLLASPTNIRLGWKSLPETNSLAYYEYPLITAVKFYSTDPGFPRGARYLKR